MKALLLILPYIFLLSTVNQQDGKDQHFIKIIENNCSSNSIALLENGKEMADYNFKSKSPIEKRFFGDFNADVEYFINPSFESAEGLRIYRDSLDTYSILELKIFPIRDKQTEATMGEIISQTIKISDSLANKIYKQTLNTISTFKSSGKPTVSYDGSLVTFRCVVDDDLWTFIIKSPRGSVEIMSNIFRLMITDISTGVFEESKFLNLLNDIN